MSSDTIQLNPEVRELLLDIAKDPRSSLFRTVPREVVTAATMDLPSLSAGTAGWTPAERHLLRGYREELAEALTGVYRRLSETATGAVNFTTVNRPPHVNADRNTEVLSRSPFASSLDPGVREVVAHLAMGAGGTVRLDTITNAISRLRNDHRSANLHGMALILEDKLPEAAHLLRAVYEQTPRDSVRYYAAINLSLALALSEAPLETTIEPIYGAIRCRPSAAGLASAMVNNCIIGKPEAARIAQDYFDDAVLPNDEALEDLQEMYQARTWTDEERCALMDLRAYSGPSSGRVIDATLH